MTPLQEDVLRAAFAADRTAVDAWRRWRSAVDWEAHLDHDAFRLMPRACRNLQTLGETDSLLPRLSGIGRQAWYANQRRAARLQPVLQQLAAANVEMLIVPPGTLPLFEPRAVIPPDAALVCAVRAEQAEAAVRCLWRQAGSSSVRLPHWALAGYVRTGGTVTWRGPDGQELRLLWQANQRDRGGRFPDEVWQRAVQGQLGLVPLLMMNADDTVHELCRQPLNGNPFRRIVDVLLMLDAMPGPVDWRRVSVRAEHAPLAPGWSEYFARLHALLPRLFPASVIAEWPVAGLPPATTAAGGMGRRVAAHWRAYREAVGEPRSQALAIKHLPGHLVARWNLPSLTWIPMRVCRGLRDEWREARR